jgi:hypothetical protein
MTYIRISNEKNGKESCEKRNVKSEMPDIRWGDYLGFGLSAYMFLTKIGAADLIPHMERMVRVII